MAWQTTIPITPATPLVTGWFAIISLLARQEVSIVNAAVVTLTIQALQTAPIINSAAATGMQAAGQSMTITNDGKSAVNPSAAQSFSITDDATWYGKPGGDTSVPIIDSASIIGLILSPQQVSIINSAVVTETLADVQAGQFVPIVDSATVIGMQVDGQSFSVISAASWYGTPVASESIVITNAATVVGYSSANISFLISNTGTVYAKLTGAQSFSITNPLVNFYGKPGAAQSAPITNSATAIQTSVKPTIVGSLCGTGNSIAIPTHQAGDDIYIIAYRVLSNALPTKPAASTPVPAWVDIDANAGANNCAMRTAHFVASANTTTSGTWANATLMGVIVFRNQTAIPVGGHAEAGGASSTSVNAPSVTQSKTDGSSILFTVHGSNGLGTPSAAPAGYTRQATVNGLCINTKDDTTSDGAIVQTMTNGTWRAAQIEVLAI